MPSKGELQCFDLQNEMKIEPKAPGLFSNLVDSQVEQLMGEQVGVQYKDMLSFIDQQTEKTKGSYESLQVLQREQYQVNHIGYLLSVAGGDNHQSQGLLQKVQEFKEKSKARDLEGGVGNLKSLSETTRKMLND